MQVVVLPSRLGFIFVGQGGRRNVCMIGPHRFGSRILCGDGMRMTAKNGGRKQEGGGYTPRTDEPASHDSPRRKSVPGYKDMWLL